MAILEPNGATPLVDANDPVAILSALDAVVYDWDIASDRIVWGPNVVDTLRELPQTALATGEGFAALMAADSDASRYLAVFNGLTADDGEGAPFRVLYELNAGGRNRLGVEDFGRWFADADGRPARVHGLLRVLTRRPPAATNVTVADGMELTLCTRRAFCAWADQRCAEPRAPNTALAMMVVGVGNLADVNRRSGYDVGDELILSVGRRLALCLRRGDKLVRYAGGKFALLVALNPNDPPDVAATRISRRIDADLYPTSGGTLRATARVGVALSPRHGRNAHLLLQRADEAFGYACETGATVTVYAADEAMAEARRREAWIADAIIAALNDRRIVLAFQKIVPTGSRLPPFEEALVRLRLDDDAVIGADAIIPVAEKMGLIELLDQRVLELVAARLAAEPAARLSLNVSLATLRCEAWFESLRDRLAATPAAAERLMIEIVETQAVDNIAELARALGRVKALGVRVAIDDFGAGHTSFRNLRSLDVDMVKIDGAFMLTLATSVDDRFFVRTLAALAKQLGVATVAEWVEDEEAARLLREWGVDYLQGHLIGRAEIPAAASPALARA